MKKTLLLSALLLGATFTQAQINSNPGSHNWSSVTAWMGGVVPTAGDVVNITSNSIITLDLPVSQTADVNILAGGSLQSMNSANDLTVTGADITNAGQINFLGSGAPTPITLDEGHLTNNGVVSCGDFDLTNTSGTGVSNNNGDFFVSGELHIMGTEVLENDLGMNVTGLMTVDADCEFINNSYASLDAVINDGLFENLSTTYIADTLWNNADFLSDGISTTVDESVLNDGDIDLLDSMNVGGDLINSGVFYNDTAVIHIGNDFWNDGTISGDGNGYYQVSQSSENDATGIINGDINICDTTLTGLYLDITAGTIDYATVTFCGVSYASAEDLNFADFTLYPNPADNQLLIDGINSGTYMILAADGRLVQSGSVNENIEISTLETGTYIINISSNDQNFKRSFIKR